MNAIKQISAMSIALFAAAGCGVEPQDQDATQDPETATAEQHADNGGCSGDVPISSCTSRSGNDLIPDFYLNVNPDNDHYWYNVEVTRPPQPTVWFGQKRLDHAGHYNVGRVNIATQPWKNGCSNTIVHMYNVNGKLVNNFWSPRICY